MKGLFVIICLFIIFNPKIDYTRDGKVLLWLGRKNRLYIVLFKL